MILYLPFGRTVEVDAAIVVQSATTNYSCGLNVNFWNLLQVVVQNKSSIYVLKSVLILFYAYLNLHAFFFIPVCMTVHFLSFWRGSSF